MKILENNYQQNRIALIIIILGLFIRLPLLFTPLIYESDAWRQADTASIAHHFLINGFKLFYPQIYWGGNGPGYVETEFQLYTFVVAVFYAMFGEQLWLGRLVSFLFTIPTMVLFYLLAGRILKPGAALWALVFFVISPLYIRYSVAFMPEATVMCFYIAGLYFFLRWLDAQDTRMLWLASLNISLAILIKPTSIHLGLIFALLAFERFGWSILKRPVGWMAATASLLPALLWYLHARNLYLQYGNTFGILSGGDNKLGNFSYWLSPYFYLALAWLDTKWIFGGIGAGVFLFGLILIIKKRQPMLIVFGLVTLLIYYMIVARYAQEEWGIQYHIYAVPFAALVIGLSFDWLAHHTSGVIRTTVMLALIGLIIAGVGILYKGMLIPADDIYNLYNKNMVNCAKVVKQLVPQNQFIIVSTTSRAVEPNGTANNYQEPVVFFYSDRYGWSLPADQHTPAKLEELHQRGGNYFVIHSEELYRAHPELAEYLSQKAGQIGPGVKAGCGLYHFK